MEPGTLYGAIAQLKKKGCIKALPTRERRRPFRIMGEGVEALREQVLTLEKVALVGEKRLAALEGY